MPTISKPLSAGHAQTYQPEGIHGQGTELLVAARRDRGRMARTTGRTVRRGRSRLRRGLCKTQPGSASADRRAAVGILIFIGGSLPNKYPPEWKDTVGPAQPGPPPATDFSA